MKGSLDWVMPSSSVVSRPLWSSRLFTLYPDLSFPRLLLFFLIVNLNQSNVLRKLVSKKIFQSYNCESKESLRSARCLGRAGKYLISCPGPGCNQNRQTRQRSAQEGILVKVKTLEITLKIAHFSSKGLRYMHQLDLTFYA